MFCLGKSGGEEKVGSAAGGDTAAGGRSRSRCAQGIELPLLTLSELAAAVVDSRVRPTRSRCAPLARFEPPVPGVALSLAARARSQLLELLCEASGLGLTAQCSCTRSAAAPMAWIRHRFYNRWVWDAGGAGKRGKAWRSTNYPRFALRVGI
jgi:hypothetical protein